MNNFLEKFIKRVEEIGQEVMKKIDDADDDASIDEAFDIIEGQLPEVKRLVAETTEEVKGRWTTVFDAVLHDQFSARATPGALATAMKSTSNPQKVRPWPGYQKVKPDSIKNLELIQSGGFGDVYRGRSRKWGLNVALKIIRGLDGQTMKELTKEADMMKMADFPYVLRLLGLYQKTRGHYVECGLVMEYMPNGSLYTLFRRVNPVPWALRFQVLHQVALGMNYLHSLTPPLLHLDLKPKNVLLDRSFDVRLADFGLSKLKNITTTGQGGGIGGTWPYKAPEALNDINYKPKEPFDVYSYGILTWSVLSGEEPYPFADTDRIKLQVPQGQRPDLEILKRLRRVKMVPEANDVMKCCWDQDPEARPPFSECIERTEPMFDAYLDEIDVAIRSVQDKLKEPITQDNDDSDSDFSSEKSNPNSADSESAHPSFFASN